MEENALAQIGPRFNNYFLLLRRRRGYGSYGFPTIRIWQLARPCPSKPCSSKFVTPYIFLARIPHGSLGTFILTTPNNCVSASEPLP